MESKWKWTINQQRRWRKGVAFRKENQNAASSWKWDEVIWTVECHKSEKNVGAAKCWWFERTVLIEEKIEHRRLRYRKGEAFSSPVRKENNVVCLDTWGEAIEEGRIENEWEIELECLEKKIPSRSISPVSHVTDKEVCTDGMACPNHRGRAKLRC